MKISQFVGATAVTLLSLGHSCSKIEKPLVKEKFINEVCATSSEILREWDKENNRLFCTTYEYMPNKDTVVSLDDILTDNIKETTPSKFINDFMAGMEFSDSRFPLFTKMNKKSGKVNTDSLKVKFYQSVLNSNLYKNTMLFVDSLCNLSPKKYAEFIKENLSSKKKIVKLPVLETSDVTVFTQNIEEGADKFLSPRAELDLFENFSDGCSCLDYEVEQIQPFVEKKPNGKIVTTYYGLKK